MSKTLVIEGLALEINTREGKTDGKPNGKHYDSLVVYEFGQTYPSVTTLSLKPDQLDEARGLCGKKVRLTGDMFEYQGRVNYAFTGHVK